MIVHGQEPGLSLATEKTEIVILTTKTIDTLIPLKVWEENIQTQKSRRQLGIQLDSKLIFWEQIKRASDTAAIKRTSLSQLMTNIDGPEASGLQVPNGIQAGNHRYSRNQTNWLTGFWEKKYIWKKVRNRESSSQGRSEIQNYKASLSKVGKRNQRTMHCPPSKQHSTMATKESWRDKFFSYSVLIGTWIIPGIFARSGQSKEPKLQIPWTV